MYLTERVRVSDRVRESKCERERICVFVREREREERECACVRERERRESVREIDREREE